MKLENINNCCILYDDNFSYHVKDYYDYIIKIIQQILTENTNIKLNIIFHNEKNISFANDNKTIHIFINFEHTLYKNIENLQQKENLKKGIISVIDDKTDTYLIRIDHYSVINKGKIIIDYSNPNIENCKLYTEYFKKLLYISPVIYPLYTEKTERNIKYLTTFNVISFRREKFIKEMNNYDKINYINICELYSTNEIIRLYRNTRILCNIHQMEERHTMEELRVLPALINGVIIICEDCPLKELIPYHEFIIWCNFANIINVIKDVNENYDLYFEKIFNNNRIKDIYEKLQNDNYREMYNKIVNVCGGNDGF